VVTDGGGAVHAKMETVYGRLKGQRRRQERTTSYTMLYPPIIQRARDDDKLPHRIAAVKNDDLSMILPGGLSPILATLPTVLKQPYLHAP